MNPAPQPISVPVIKKGAKVLTRGGTYEYASDCRRIQKEYFLEGRDCFFINDKWWRIDSLYFDEETGEYLTTKQNLIAGLVGFNVDGSRKMGYYSPNPYTNAVLRTDGMSVPVKDPTLFDQVPGKYHRERGTDTYFVTAETTASQRVLHRSPHNSIEFTSKGYNIEDNGAEMAVKAQLYKEYKKPLSKDVRAYARFLKSGDSELTFGAEFESAVGCLSPNDQNKFNIVACRDGSITQGGGEFVTGILSGAKGLQTLSDACDQMTTDLKADITCSMHLHIGGMEITKNLVVTLYVLFQKIQEEYFTMLPYYKSNWQGIKKKDYCARLKTRFPSYKKGAGNMDNFKEWVSMAFNQIFYFLSDEHPACKEYNTKLKVHPIKHKWDRKSRYSALSLSNMLFGGRGTAEFRASSATYNAQKVINWVFINAAIIRYAESHPAKIHSDAKISMEDVLNYYTEAFPGSRRAAFLSEYLIAYFRERQAQMKKDFEVYDDRTGERELAEDSSYTFSWNGVTRLF